MGEDAKKALLTFANLDGRPDLSFLNLSGQRRHLTLRVLEVDRLLAGEILVAGLIVLGTPDEHKVSERLRQVLALVVVRKPLAPLSIPSRTLRQNMLNSPIRGIKVLWRACQLVVKA